MWVGVHPVTKSPVANHRECQAGYKKEQRLLPEVGEAERERDRLRGSARPNRQESLTRYNGSEKRKLVGKRYYTSPHGRLVLEKNNTAYRARKFKAEGSHTPEEWRAMVEACGSRCAKCNEVRKMTRDHIVPLTKGGTDYISNIQPLCRPCNTRKSNKESP